MRLAVPTPASAAVDSMPLLIAAFCLLWSSAFAVTKLALQDCPPLLLLVARFLLTAGVMLGAAAASRAPWRFSWRDVTVFALLGLVNNALYLGLNVTGMRSISAGLSALISSLNPVLTALLATAFLGEQMTWRKALGLVLGVGGVGVIVEGRIAGGTDASIGVVFSIAALISLVGGTILFKRLAPNGGLWIGNGVQHLAGAVMLVPFAFGIEPVADVVPSWRLLGALAYLALLVSVIGYLIWFRLLAVVGATTASAYHFLMPPLGMLFGWLLLGERLAWLDFVGVMPVVLGIYLVTRRAKFNPA